MLNKKRKLQSIKDNANNPEKKKAKLDEFSEIEFKALLRDAGATFTGLQRFIEQANRFPDESQLDIVANFCRTSSDCSEILKLLHGKMKQQEIFLALECLRLILVRITSDLRKYKSSAQSVVQQLVSTAMSAIYSQLSVKNKSSHIKSALKILCIMVKQGNWAAKEILTRLDLSDKNMILLLNRKDMKDPEDVKMCLVQFVISLLNNGNNTVIKMLLEAKGFMHSLLGSLHGDRAEVIHLVTSTLQSKVLCNSGMSKTNKIRLFNERAMKDIGRLYRWVGPKRWQEMTRSKNNKQQEEEEPAVEFDPSNLTEDQQLVRSSVHELLTELCCSHKNGITFNDKTFSTSGQNMNHILTGFLATLHQPYKDPLVSELVISSLRSCPDQLTFYLSAVKHICLARATVGWMSTVEFLLQIYEAQPLISPGIRLIGSSITSDKLAEIILATILPQKDVWSCFIQALQFSSSSVVHKSMTLISFVLRRLAATIREVEKHPRGDAADGVPDPNDILTLLQEAIIKHFPGITTLNECWNRALQYISTEESTQENDLPVFALSDQLAMILKVMSSYCMLVPSACRRQKLEFSSLISGITRTVTQTELMETDDEVTQSTNEPRCGKSMLHLYLLKLFSVSDVRLADLIKKVPGSKPALYLLLDMVADCSKIDQRMSNTSLNLMIKLIENSGLFKGNMDEIRVWLCHLTSVDSSNRQEILDYFISCLDQLLNDPCLYSEYIAEATSLMSTNANNSQPTVETKVSIEAILSAEELPLVDDDTDSKSEAKTNAFRLPFSPLLPCFLHNLAKTAIDREKKVLTFVDGVLVDVMYLQQDPSSLCLFVRRHKSVLSKTTSWKLVNRLMSSDKKRRSSIDKIDVKGKSLNELLELEFLCENGSVINKKVEKKLWPMAELLSSEECVQIAKQIILYFNVTAKNFIQGVSTFWYPLQFYVKLLQRVIQRFWNLCEAEKQLESEICRDEFSFLEASDKTLLLTLRDLCCCIFSSDTVLVLFFCKSADSVGLDDEDEENRVKASKVISEELCSLAEKVSNCFPNDGVSVFAGCVQKLESESENSVTFANLITKNLNAVKCLLGALSLPTLSNVCRCLLDQPHSSLVNQSQLSLVDQSQLSLVNQSQLSLVDQSHSSLVDGDELTPSGFIILHSARRFLESSSLAENHTLIQILKNLFELLISFESKSFCQLLIDCVTKEPACCNVLDERIFVKLLETKNSDVLHVLASVISQTSSKHLLWLSDWCMTNEMWRKKKNVSNYMEVLFAAANRCTDEISLKAFGRFICDTYWDHLLSEVCSSEFGDCKNQTLVSDFLRILTRHFANSDEREDCWQRSCMTISNMPLATSQVELYIRIFEDLSPSEASDDRHLEEFLSACVRGALVLLSEKELNDIGRRLLDAIFNCLSKSGTRSCQSTVLRELISDVWLQFVKTGIKHQFGDYRFLRALDTLTFHLYGKRETIDDRSRADDRRILGVPVAEIFEWVAVGQSQFGPTICKEESSETKDCLVSLLLTLVRCDSQCCRTLNCDIIMIALFGAYQATLSLTDQKLLTLMRLFEENGCQLTEFRPYFWGSKAVEEARKKIDLSHILVDHSIDQVVDLLDPSRLYQSMLNFPLRRKLTISLSTLESETFESNAAHYDPSFLLPVFCHLLSDDSVVNCLKFVERNCLGYVFASLSSHDLNMRALGYQILTRFYSHLEGARFGAQRQFLVILDLLCRSLDKPSTKLACIVTVFLAKAAHIMLSPDDHMFTPINQFLLLKPSLDILNVPEFYKFFFSSDLEYKVERSWALNLLLDGLRETQDYHICEKRFTFKIILSFYLSPMCDQPSKIQILKILKKACSTRTIAWDLVKKHAILAWIANVSSMNCSQLCDKQSANSASAIASGLVDVLSALWFSLIGQTEPADEARTKLPPMVTAETLLTVKAIMNNFRSADYAESKEDLMKILSSTQHMGQHTSELFASLNYYFPVPKSMLHQNTLQ